MTQFAVRDFPITQAQESGAARLAGYFWPVAALLLAVRIVLSATCNLVPDEAFYWTWTRHLSTGYFDHPPMVAWLIWLSTRVLGDTELGVRLPAAVLSIGSLAILYSLAGKILKDRRAVGYVVLMWIAGPLLAVNGTIVTPDAPATFFSMCALTCAVRVAGRDDDAAAADPSARNHSAAFWIFFGLFSGLALLSKYTTVLVPAGIFLALLTSRSGRRHLRGPWVYLSGVIALCVFSPTIYWNATHHWASFLFQLHHGAGGGLSAGKHGICAVFIARAMGLAEFIGGQALVWTPILFAVAIAVAIVNWRKYSRLSNVNQMLLWSGTLPLLFFGWAATSSHGEINWPAFAYFPLSLLVGRYLSENWRGNRVHLVRKGCEVAIGFTIVIHLIAMSSVQQWLLRHDVPFTHRGFPLTHQITDLWGWPQFGRQLAADARGIPVVCNRHQDAGEAAFYMPGRPDVWCEVGSRPTAFDYYDRGRPDYSRIPEALFVGGNKDADKFMARFGYTMKSPPIEVQRPGLGKAKSNSAIRVSR
ncbi:MAG TPA: glycosyltransferase family 39 protein [Tepidisphaeraceae bacterium]|jgi:4-amino-4-deoxy-L-arabinose transferase-like glycosyltransferase|nr:glycosyltransferase family 39 protein [Tepidisphaeraceae bacterium]